MENVFHYFFPSRSHIFRTSTISFSGNEKKNNGNKWLEGIKWKMASPSSASEIFSNRLWLFILFIFFIGWLFDCVLCVHQRFCCGFTHIRGRHRCWIAYKLAIYGENVEWALATEHVDCGWSLQCFFMYFYRTVYSTSFSLRSVRSFCSFDTILSVRRYCG